MFRVKYARRGQINLIKLLNQSNIHSDSGVMVVRAAGADADLMKMC
jgi:hypothetical protein